MRRYHLLTGSLKDLSDLLFIVFGVALVSTNKLTIDNFVVIYMYQSRTYSLLNSITNLAEEIKKFLARYASSFHLGLIRSIYNLPCKFKKEVFGKKHLDKINGDFEFKNVCFGYDQDRQILKNMSFKISANETVSFVGPSGGGKSTIFSLIDRLYKVDSGEILIDGININKLDRNSIRDNISIITQNPYIFNFTIKENLKITKKDGITLSL